MDTPLRSEKSPVLISIICRSVNRPTLAQTLDSVCQQSWKNIELVVVDALGTGAITLPTLPAHITLRLVCTGKQLDRPKAANAGLKAAQGEYLLFLDDDDWIDAKHLQSLIRVMQAEPAVNVVYSATQMVSEHGIKTKDIIAVPFDITTLRRDNFIPIHSALFSRELLDLGCCFDESLPIYEDWDFWLQCAEHTRFTLLNKVGAYYRMGGDSHTMLEQHQQRYQAGHPSADARSRLLEKWRLRWSGAEWNALLGLVDQTPALTQLHDELSESHGLLDTRTAELNKARNQLEQVEAKLKAKKAEFLTLQRALAALRSEADLLSAAANTLQENNQTLHREIESLQRGSELLRQDISALHNDKQQLSSVIEQLHSELNESQRALEQTTQRLSTSHAQLAATEQALADTQGQLNHTSEQLNLKVSELGDANAVIAQTQQQLQSTEHKLQLLQSDYISLNLAHEELDRGVKEILNSFSWRVTAPYRWMRHRLNKLVAAVLPRRTASSLSGAVQHPAQQPVSSIQAGIVWPSAEHTVLPDHFTVQGWAWSSNTVVSVQIFVDQDLFYDVHPLPAHDRLEDAQRIGFARLISTTDLTPGQHQISLVARDEKGQQNRVSRNFIFQPSVTVYQRWLRDTSPDADALQAQSETSIPSDRTFTVLVQFDDSIHADARQLPALRATLISLSAQTCKEFECLISAPAADQAALHDLVQAVLPAARLINPDNIWPSLQACNSTAVCLLAAGDVLRPDCLWRVAFAWQENTVLLYSDHDQIDSNGNAVSPMFTTEWSPDRLLSQNYIGNVYFADSRQVTNTHPVDTQTSSWRFSVLLELGLPCRFNDVTRIADVLWSAAERPASARERELAAETQALANYLEKHALHAKVQPIEGSECRRVQWSVAQTPLVSIIIPTTGNMRFLKPCLDTLKTSTYPAIEVVILDNSRGKFPDGIQYAHEQGAVVIDCNEAFNWSRLNNIGADKSHGELLLFLNDDIEIIQPDWLEELVAQALRDDVGTVGALLLYPNGAIQHGGVFLVDHGGGARHLFHKQLPGEGIYGELDKCVREVSGNTGACQMIRRDRFEQLGRFDEQLSIVGNDIDLCMRALEAGLRNVWTPHSRLIHHESVSRQSKPIGQDEKAMWDRWQHRFLGGDPYFNPNMDLTREDYVLAPVPSASSVVVPDAAATTNESGVHLIAYIRASMGVGEAARGNAAALEASGVPFGILNYEKGNPSRMDNLRWQHREISKPRYGINLIHINADHTPGVMKDLGKNWFGQHYNIGFWAWEMPEFPDRWLESFDLLDEVWVPSAYVNQAVAAKSPIPVVTIPHIINVDVDSAHQYSRAYFGIPDKAFVFISMFDTHSIAQRKNPFGSIMAFQKAFAADDSSVQLLIKINNADEGSLKILRSLVGDYQNIVLLDTHFDRAQIDSLINCCDCYVSLHHAEGFGLGPAEAMSLGKVALLTGWSGNTEYMRSNNCVAIQYTLKKLGKDYGPYEAHQHWAVPDVDHAATEMRDLAHNPARVKAIGEQARKTIQQEFSAAAVGERMRQRLQSIERILDARRKQQ